MRQNFKDTIRQSFLRYAFVPIILLFVLFLVFTVAGARLMIIQQSKYAGDEIRSELSKVLQSYTAELERMASSQDVSRLLTSRSGTAEVFEQFYEFNNEQNVKSIFHVLDKERKLLASSALNVPGDAERKIAEIIGRLARSESNVLVESNRIAYSHQRFTSYTLAGKVHNDGTTVGYVLFQLHEEDLEAQLFGRSSEIAIVTDRYQYIIATTNNIVRGLLNKLVLSASGDEAVIQGNTYHVNRAYIPEGPWYVYTLNSLDGQRNLYISLAIFFGLTTILLWFIIQKMAERISSRHTRSVYKLMHAVRSLQAGEMNAYVNIRSGDEFEMLGHQYNVMLRSLNDLKARNEQLSELRRVAEMKHLQAQFHPHFIFNVLETLRYAIVVDAKKAQEIVMILSRLLRYSLNTGRTAVRLNEDLRYVSDYLRLHQLRFQDRLTYNVRMSEEAEQALVPRMMAQIAIENSIKYGYQGKDRLTIIVNATIEGEDLVVRIEDDGEGMSAERLREVRSLLTAIENPTEHVGLHNLNRRLVLLYGEPYGVRITSVQGTGTTVKIVIPYQKGEA